MSKLQKFVNKNELGAGTRGSSLSFDAIRFEALNNGFDLGDVTYLLANNEVLFNKHIKQDENALNIDGLLDYYKKNIKILMKEIDYSKNQFFYSADHASSGLYLSAFKRLNPDARIGVIWIDAHGDMHSPYTTPSGNMHGMTLSIALREENLEWKKRDINEDLKRKWKELQLLSGDKKALNYGDLVFIGIRDLEKEEKYILDQNNVKHYLVDEARDEGIEECAKDVLDMLKKCDHIYISFDVDSMDPRMVSFGTGTPVSKGFSLEETKSLINVLTSSDKKVTFEIVEINPLLDSQDTMVRKCLDIIEVVYNNLDK